MSALTDDVARWTRERAAAPTPEALRVAAAMIVTASTVDDDVERLVVSFRPGTAAASRVYFLTGDERGGWGNYPTGITGSLPEVLLTLAAWIAG